MPERFLEFVHQRDALPSRTELREECPADREFLYELYASTRAQELALVDWPEADKKQFLRDQFDRQWQHYRQHYPHAEWLVVMRGSSSIGRIYLESTQREVRLMDIALIDAERGRGLGTALTQLVLAWAATRELPVSLHVEPFNPAYRLYQRLGFQAVEMRGIYCFMEKAAAIN